MKPLAGTPAQRGGMVLGVIFGLLLGLGIALGVAMYIAKVPMPFVDKAGVHRSPEQAAAEAERLRNWDPNAGLAGRSPRPVFAPASEAAAVTPVAAASAPLAPVEVIAVNPARRAASAPGAASGPKPARDPAAILAGKAPAASAMPAAQAVAPVQPVPPVATRSAESRTELTPSYQVQAGAYSSATEAEQQRARLALQGFSARVYEREVNGRMVYRVRIGPFDTREDADRLRDRLQSASMNAIVIPVPPRAQ